MFALFSGFSVNAPDAVNAAWASAVFAEAGKVFVAGTSFDKELKPFMKKRLVQFDKALPPVLFDKLDPTHFTR